MARATGRPRQRHRSVGQLALAFLILVVAGYLLLHVVIGLVAFLATILVAVVAIAAVIWALRVLL